MLAAMRCSRLELSIVLCDDQAIHALNRQYRRIDRPTDVLAFAMQEGLAGGFERTLLGDVVISVETAAKQARLRGAPLVDELVLLLAHGLLHLLGFDHGTRAEERRMVARTDMLRAAGRIREAAF
jgi:probable rRNA maturation factor